MKVVEGEQRKFMTGNEVVAWAALAAGADMMCGYPITPQNEIMHVWAVLAKEHGLGFLQTEDELSAGFATIGAVLAGKRAFSATAGPGNVLMQEPISMAEMMRIPVVWVVQQRGGPSTATVIYSQQELRLTCFGGNGEGHRIVYSTASHQDLYDYTIKAFATAWRTRFPTFVLGDGYQGKMLEAVTFYNPEDRGSPLATAEPFVGRPGTPGVDRPPAHLRNTYSIEEELYEALAPNIRDYEEVARCLVEFEMDECERAQIILVAHGIVARAAREAAGMLRARGIRAGYFRPITLRPFPATALAEAARGAGRLLVVESAYGQLAGLVREELYAKVDVDVHAYLKPGVGITSEEIVDFVGDGFLQGQHRYA
ncbi:MAG: ferredoxin oxidoreductase [Firmicutes bacterium]|jgi:2-oxoglutarate ferredoxin oxidoreductase subunit alpha|nr:ferredoxin oxidoreductase [Bacillota bacterium]MDH7496204.1 transketolase C-terminal domain-containing protein [Bacillota bacterium]